MIHEGRTVSQILGICSGIGILILLALAYGVHAAECADPALHNAGEDVCADSDGWDPLAKLDEIGNTQAQTATPAAVKWPERSRTNRWDKAAYGLDDPDDVPSTNNAISDVANNSSTTAVAPAQTQTTATAPAIIAPVEIIRSSESLMMLSPLADASKFDVIVDVSDGVEEHITGAILLNYADLEENGTTKPADVLAGILGSHGISENDSVLIYGECQPCGGGPSAGTYAYWVMKYLGHENVRLLDGGIADWVRANGSIGRTPATRSAAVYNPTPRTDLLATYDYVKSEVPQVVDGRTMNDFGMGSIPGAVNIPYESLLSGARLKDEASLDKIFTGMGLTKDRPVVVYTNTGIKASMVWFALEMTGFDAQVYSWEDWVAHK